MPAKFDLVFTAGVQLDPNALRSINQQVKDAGASIDIKLANGQRVIAELDKIRSVSAAAAKETHGLGNAIQLAGKRAIAYSLATVGLFKLSNAIATATQGSLQFEKEQAKIAQTLGRTNKEIRAQGGELLKISRDYGIFATKAAETYRVLAQAGFTAAEAKRGTDLLAKTTLLATFDDLADTTEGLISLIRTFGLEIRDAEAALSAINVASKKYAVESDDIIQAIKRAGGIFAATQGDFKDLIALITTVRDTTREGAETIATSFRTIFARLQRPKTIEYFKDLNIQLTTASGEFVGNLESIKLIAQGLNKLGITPGTLKFAEIVEEIGGIRQISKVIPLLTQYQKTQQVLNDINKEGASLDKDAALAKETLSFQIQNLQRNFDQLFIEISNNDDFRSLIQSMLDLANAAIELGRALSSIKGFVPILAGIASFGAGRIALNTGRSLLSGNVPLGGVGISGRNKGGKIYGIGNKDTELSLLTPGEFVVNAESARKYGYGNLERINRYNVGGRVGSESEAITAITYYLSKLGLVLDDLPTITELTAKQKAKGVSVTGGEVSGSFSLSSKKIALDYGKATGKTIAHELAHLLDSQAGGGSFASKKEGHLFNEIVKELKNQGLAGKGYKQNDEEIFADYITKIVTGALGKKNTGLGSLIFKQQDTQNPGQVLNQLKIGGVLGATTQLSDEQIQSIIAEQVGLDPNYKPKTSSTPLADRVRIAENNPIEQGDKSALKAIAKFKAEEEGKALLDFYKTHKVVYPGSGASSTGAGGYFGGLQGTGVAPRPPSGIGLALPAASTFRSSNISIPDVNFESKNRGLFSDAARRGEGYKPGRRYPSGGIVSPTILSSQPPGLNTPPVVYPSQNPVIRAKSVIIESQGTPDSADKSKIYIPVSSPDGPRKRGTSNPSVTDDDILSYLEPTSKYESKDIRRSKYRQQTFLFTYPPTPRTPPNYPTTNDPISSSDLGRLIGDSEKSSFGFQLDKFLSSRPEPDPQIASSIESLRGLGPIVGELGKSFATTGLAFAFASPIISATVDSLGLTNTKIGDFANGIGELTSKVALLAAAVSVYYKIQANENIKKGLGEAGEGISNLLNLGKSKIGGSKVGSLVGGSFASVGKFIAPAFKWLAPITKYGALAATWLAKVGITAAKLGASFNLLTGGLASVLFSNLNSKSEFNTAVGSGNKEDAIKASVRGQFGINFLGDIASGIGATVNLFTSLAGIDVQKWFDNFGIGLEDLSNSILSYIPGFSGYLAAAEKSAEKQYEIARGLKSAEDFLSSGGNLFDSTAGSLVGFEKSGSTEEGKELTKQIFEKNSERISAIQNKVGRKGGSFTDFTDQLFKEIATGSTPEAAKAFAEALFNNTELIKEETIQYESLKNILISQQIAVDKSNKSFLSLLLTTSKLEGEFDNLDRRFKNVDITQELLSGIGPETIKRSLRFPSGNIGDVVRKGGGSRLIDQASIIGPESQRQARAAVDITQRLQKLDTKQIAVGISNIEEQDQTKRTGRISDFLNDIVGDTSGLSGNIRDGIDSFIQDFSGQLAQGSEEVELNEIYKKFQDVFDELISKDLIDNINRLGDRQAEGLKRYMDTLSELDKTRFEIQAKYNEIAISRLTQRQKENQRDIDFRKKINPNFQISGSNFRAERNDIARTFGAAGNNLRGQLLNNPLSQTGNFVAGANGQLTAGQQNQQTRFKELSELSIKASEAFIGSFEREISQLEEGFSQAQRGSQVRAGLAKDFAFSDSGGRRDILRTQSDTQLALRSGIDAVRGSRRGGVRNLLEQFSGAGKLSFLGGKTAEEAIADLTVQPLLRSGRIGQGDAENLRKSIAGKATPVEQRIAESIQQIYGKIGEHENNIIQQQANLVGIEEASVNLFAASVQSFGEKLNNLFSPDGGFGNAVTKLESLMKNELQVKIQDTNVIVTVQGMEPAMVEAVQKIVFSEVSKQIKDYADQKDANPIAPFKPNIGRA